MTEPELSAATRAAVLAHLAAFNDHDSGALLAGLSDDVVWRTGTDTFRGRSALVDVFDDWLWGMAPQLEVVRLLVDGDAASAECVEHMVINGAAVQFPVAIFITVQSDLLTAVTVFREGSADLTPA